MGLRTKTLLTTDGFALQEEFPGLRAPIGRSLRLSVGGTAAKGVLRYLLVMNPARKRTVRLVVALTAAVVLASALIYTSFSAASPALSPSQLVHEVQPGRSYQLTGTVVKGSVRRAGSVLGFSVEDRVGGTTIPVAYTGTVPDPFREGREVIVTVQKQGSRFVGERDSLITKCPSKYKSAPASENQNS
jgi:cytochrome c-type biogenesis protein CcmE